MAKATLNTNSTKRKEQAHKSGKCQVCGEKTDGYSVHIDYDKGKVVKSRKGKAREGRAFYCEAHADKKVKRLEWKLRQRNGETTKRKPAAKKAKATTAKKRTTKKATTRKATKATAAKPKRATTKKATAKKATTKRTAKATAAKPKPKRAPKKRVAKKATAKPAAAAAGNDPF